MIACWERGERTVVGYLFLISMLWFGFLFFLWRLYIKYFLWSAVHRHSLSWQHSQPWLAHNTSSPLPLSCKNQSFFFSEPGTSTGSEAVWMMVCWLADKEVVSGGLRRECFVVRGFDWDRWGWKSVNFGGKKSSDSIIELCIWMLRMAAVLRGLYWTDWTGGVRK